MIQLASVDAASMALPLFLAQRSSTSVLATCRNFSLASSCAGHLSVFKLKTQLKPHALANYWGINISLHRRATLSNIASFSPLSKPVASAGQPSTLQIWLDFKPISTVVDHFSSLSLLKTYFGVSWLYITTGYFFQNSLNCHLAS